MKVIKPNESFDLRLTREKYKGNDAIRKGVNVAKIRKVSDSSLPLKYPVEVLKEGSSVSGRKSIAAKCMVCMYLAAV